MTHENFMSWFIMVHNKVNCATDEDSACTMTQTVPNAIKTVVIFKNGKRYCLEI
jgi:hypothetical protein